MIEKKKERKEERQKDKKTKRQKDKKTKRQKERKKERTVYLQLVTHSIFLFKLHTYICIQLHFNIVSNF